ncbi:hypothetical protein TNCV_476651 [Trichonephila clavipes]|nr:hypothetical protein TNCV_476651 [Trichonephila clavipes]
MPRTARLGPARLFSVLKNKIDAQGEASRIGRAVIQAVTNELNSIPVQALLEVYENWKTRWQQCIDAEGCYLPFH